MSLRPFTYEKFTRYVKSIFPGLYKFIVLTLTLGVSQTHDANKNELPAGIHKISPRRA